MRPPRLPRFSLPSGKSLAQALLTALEAPDKAISYLATGNTDPIQGVKDTVDFYRDVPDAIRTAQRESQGSRERLNAALAMPPIPGMIPVPRSKSLAVALANERPINPIDAARREHLEAIAAINARLPKAMRTKRSGR